MSGADADADLFTVTIRTTCPECAMALAGHVPGLKTVRLASVTVKDGERIVTKHMNSAWVKIHDGSLPACPKHGVTMDLSREPGEAPSKPAAGIENVGAVMVNELREIRHAIEEVGRTIRHDGLLRRDL